MASPMFKKSIEKYIKSFQGKEKIPIEFSSTTVKPIYNCNNRDFINWYFALTLTGLVVASGFYELVKQFRSPELDMTVGNIVILFVFFLASTLTLVLAHSLYRDGEILINSWDGMKVLIEMASKGKSSIYYD